MDQSNSQSVLTSDKTDVKRLIWRVVFLSTTSVGKKIYVKGCFGGLSFYPPADHLAADHLVHVICGSLLLVHSPTCLTHMIEDAFLNVPIDYYFQTGVENPLKSVFYA